MRLTNGTDTVNLTNQIQIRAYLTSGYYVADGEPTADEPEETMDSLRTAKMLLGIKDDGQDYLLTFLIDDMENLINSYCHTAEVPTKLRSLVPQMAAEMYRRKGYGQTAAPQVIKSVTEDKRSVSFETSSASTDTDEFLKEYESRLKPYRCRKGFLPSDISKRKLSEHI